MNKDTNNRTLEYINFYRENGFNLVPLKPNGAPLVEWKPYQTKKATDAEVGEWMAQTESFAIVTGSISSLVVLDIDAEDLFEGLHLGPLAAKTYTEKRGNRYHIFLRTKTPIASEPLSFEGKEDIGILSEGHLVSCGGMPHYKGGEQYRHLDWSPKTIIDTTAESIEALKRFWRDYRGLVTKTEKGLSTLPKGIDVTTPLLEIIEDCVALKEVKETSEGIVCRCPLPGHTDEDPSFFINTEKNVFFCHGCAKGGGAIEFVSTYYKIAKKEAIKQLERKGALTVAEKESEEVFKHKCFFEEDGTLYMEVFTPESNEYSYAYLKDGGVELTDSVGDTKPVELLLTKEGEPAQMVKIPSENVTTCDLLSPAALQEKLRTHLKTYCDLSELDIDLSLFYILFTWFYRKLNTVGYLRFVADTGKGKSRMLTAISELCFYPLSAAGSGSFSGMMRQNESWHGTVVIDEADRSPDQVINYCLLGIEKYKYYLMSNKRDPSKQEAFEPFGPKIFSMREPFRDVALEGRCASISPDETRSEEIPILIDETYYKKTRELRDEIARFVLEHWYEVDGEKLLSFRGLGLEPRIQQMAMPLSVIAQLWPEWKDRIIEHAISRKKELTKERAQSWAGGMFNLVLDIATGEEILSEYSAFYNGNNEIVAITPSMIAKALKITTKTATRTLRGIGFELEQIHVSMFDGNGNTKGKKRVRCYKVPSMKKWEDITGRYYYNEDRETQTSLPGTVNNNSIEIPEILKAQKFIKIGPLGPLGPGHSTHNKIFFNLDDNSIDLYRFCLEKKSSAIVPVRGPSGPSGPKNVCDSCGRDAETTFCGEMWLCNACIAQHKGEHIKSKTLEQKTQKRIIGQFNPDVFEDDKKRYTQEAI